MTDTSNIQKEEEKVEAEVEEAEVVDEKIEEEEKGEFKDEEEEKIEIEEEEKGEFREEEKEEEEDIIIVHYEEEDEKEEEEEEEEEEIIEGTYVMQRLRRDYLEMKRSKGEDLGFSAFLKKKDLFRWEIRVFGFEKESGMYHDLQRYKELKGRDYVEMSVRFPPKYPLEPPFIRVVQPRFVAHTGRVTAGGSLCMDVLTLTPGGWSPAYNIKTLMINVISEILNRDPRIDFDNLQPYTLSEAKSSYQYVAGLHGWEISKWLPKD